MATAAHALVTQAVRAELTPPFGPPAFGPPAFGPPGKPPSGPPPPKPPRNPPALGPPGVRPPAVRPPGKAPAGPPPPKPPRNPARRPATPDEDEAQVARGDGGLEAIEARCGVAAREAAHRHDRLARGELDR